MSLIKKSDVKNHLSSRYRTKIHLSERAGLPDATGYSGNEPNVMGASLSAFARDYAAEHTTAVTPANPVNSTDSQGPEISRIARP